MFLLVGTVLAVGLGIGLFTSLGAPPSGVPAAGGRVPAFTLERLGGGGKVGIPADGGGSGRPVVLVFFASWCTPCQREIPTIAALYRHQPARRRVAVVGVDGADPTAAALAFVHKSGVTFPVAADPEYSVTSGLFDFQGEPDTVFIEGNGSIAHIVHGPVTTSILLSWERRIS